MMDVIIRPASLFYLDSTCVSDKFDVNVLLNLLLQICNIQNWYTDVTAADPRAVFRIWLYCIPRRTINWHWVRQDSQAHTDCKLP